MLDQAKGIASHGLRLAVAGVVATAVFGFSFDEDERPARRSVGKAERGALFKTQNGRCNYCGVKRGIEELHADHKTPLARRGPHTYSNLQLLCGPCNNRKGTMTDGEFRRRFKLTPTRKAKGPPKKVIPPSYFKEKAKAVAKRKTAKRRDDADDRWSIF